MAGSLNKDISGSFGISFKTNCLTLIGEAYKYIKESNDITIDMDEETISAKIYTYIENSKEAIRYNINICNEYRLYCQDVISNKKSAKSAPRIDFRLSTNNTYEIKRVNFYIEAKILIENNCKKQGRKTNLNAASFHKSYVLEGMDRFISAKYPSNGCMLGYVLEGTITSIVAGINKSLSASNRKTEILKPDNGSIPHLDSVYFSNHTNKDDLYHYFLDFCN